MAGTCGKPKLQRYRHRKETENKHREEIEKAGNLYRWQKKQREEHERQQQKAEARQTPQSRTDRIVTYLQRRYVNEPSQITGNGE